MATLTKLKMFGLALILTASSTASADFLRLEQDGIHQIMARIKAATARYARDGGQMSLDFSYDTRVRTHVVNVSSPLATRILIDGQPSGIQLYRAKVNENGAVLMLTDETIQISYENATGRKILRRVAFTNNDAKISIAMPEHPVDPRGEGHGIDSEVKKSAGVWANPAGEEYRCDGHR